MTKPLIGIGADILCAPGQRDRAFAYTTYVDALRRSGAIPLVLPPQPENAAALVGEIDGLILAGGYDCDPALYGEACHPSIEPMDPRRQENELALAKAAHERGIPTLGICLGMQMMNVAAGGSLIQDIDTQLGTDIQHASPPENRVRHDVGIEPDTQLASILRAQHLNVNSSHHQAVRDVAAPFRVTAKAADGIVEGLEDPRLPFYIGVQWHPEDMPGEDSASKLFAALIEAAKRFRQARLDATRTPSPLAPASPQG